MLSKTHPRSASRPCSHTRGVRKFACSSQHIPTSAHYIFPDAAQYLCCHGPAQNTWKERPLQRANLNIETNSSSISLQKLQARYKENHQHDNYKKRPEWPLPRRRRSTSTLSSPTPSSRGFFVGFHGNQTLKNTHRIMRVCFWNPNPKFWPDQSFLCQLVFFVGSVLQWHCATPLEGV